ncbi:MAG: PEP-CTERM sorting domain-containing protein [Nitrosomonas sp.]|uniref:PEP-CTERM sorting domain-containing protein n=1 Tax=Nitrosomonas sp. TaxID=42353 RepID=UPI0025CDC419|nr:PEP-CTERM sorting domain-containing protein [Nitrosomonas sp.]UJP04008.1 MAG: PEP-CTERM sorting domain-containing protein [Nitrosomonas sp.]
MKLEWKKNRLGQVAICALFSIIAATAQAAPAVISGFNTSAAIDDAGYFSPAGSLGLSFLGREYVNHGTFASNWRLNANGGAVAVADESIGSNPLGSTAFAVTGHVAIITNLGVGGGWNIVETVSIPADGHVAVQVQLTNNTGATANHVQWGVGVDPDQGIPGGAGFNTGNTIDALGNLASVTATSSDGWLLTLRNTTSASAFAIAPYIDPSACCSPVDPAVMLGAAQGIGNYGFADHSINLAYDLGTIANHQSVSFGYEYIMAVPEPETYAMLLAGLGLIGFSARRRRMM